MASLEDRPNLGTDRSGLQLLIGPVSIAYLPVKNLIRLLFPVVSENGSVRIESLVWIHQNRQLLVLDLDQLGGVGCCVAILGHDKSYLLRLEQNFSSG
jgi:hypothetical protein